MRQFATIRFVDTCFSNYPKDAVLLRSWFADFLTPRLVAYEIAETRLALCSCSLQCAEYILQCAGGKRDLLSYRHRFSEHLLSQLRIQPLLGHDFNPTAKEIFEIQNKASGEPGCGCWPDINK